MRVSCGPTPTARSLLGARWKCEESIPLNATISNITCDKVSLRSNVNLVSSLVVIIGFQNGLSGKYCVPRILATLSYFSVLTCRFDSALVVHLISNRRPDTIRTNQYISLNCAAISQGDGNTFALALILIGCDWISIHNKVLLQSFAFVDKDFLKVGSVDDTSVRKTEQIGTLLQRKFNKPISRGIRIPQIINRIIRHSEGSIRSKTILDTTGACSCESELLHYSVKELVVNLFQNR
mmetsp:Transcript_74849/g.217263  ORF Transcript_74849/g.217263 Transcript_74849/m.217263 type:complete len:237 (-) Transcript_74849:415-1125(-)